MNKQKKSCGNGPYAKCSVLWILKCILSSCSGRGVGEVLAVIRRPVNRGLTCIIVTHEMNFTKAVNSRVIYMDEKGIYEMDPPAHIFGAPKREKVKAFINRLKTFQQTITERNFNIYGLNNAAMKFCKQQFASEKQIYRVQLVLGSCRSM